MAGHSQFKNIMHRKGAQDKIRAKIFSKLAKEITVAAKSGLPDPASNPRLRTAILAARAENMPKDNIERAIKKGSPGEDTTNYEEIRYEGFGPANVSVIVETLTDNRARTAPNMRTIFGKKGGQLGNEGSVMFNFEKVGYIEYPSSIGDYDTVFESVVEAGADDLVQEDDTYEIYCKPDDLASVRDSMEKTFGDPKVCRLDYKPLVMVDVTDIEKAQVLTDLISALNEDDDVQRIITNANIPDEIMEKLQ